MEKFYRASRTIILFLIVMLVIDTAFSEKTTQRTAILILISMLLINADTMAKFLDSATRVFDVNSTNVTTKTDTTGQSATHVSSSGVVHGGGGKSF